MRVFLNKTKQSKTNRKSRRILTINIEGLYSMKWELGEGGSGEFVRVRVCGCGGGGGGESIGVRLAKLSFSSDLMSGVHACASVDRRSRQTRETGETFSRLQSRTRSRVSRAFRSTV